jgi:CO dehydrogenase maturation factor
MKIAISGKGGVGKTTLAGVMARILGARGGRVIALDADPDSNLASAIGIPESEISKVQPLAQMQEFIEERTGTKKGQYGAFFQINPRVDDILERFSLEKEGVRLIMLGSIPQGGGGCFCPESALLKSFLSHVLIERDDYVIVDMEAGLEHLGRGTTEYIDALIIVVEPGKRSFQTALQIRKLSQDIGIKRVYVVGNKITGEEDLQFMKGHLSDFVLLGNMRYNEKIIEADKLGLSPYDLDPKIRAEVEEIIKVLEKQQIKVDGK